MKPLILLAVLAAAVGLMLPVPAAAQGAGEDKAKINEQARLKIESDVANCRARENSGAFKTNREAAQCINSAIQRTMLSIRYPYTDLLQLVSAFRVGCAGKVDAGQMTKEDCKRQMAQLRKRVTEEEARRRGTATTGADSEGRPVARVKRSSMASLVKGIAKWTDPEDPAPANAKHMTCMQVGRTVSCY